MDKSPGLAVGSVVVLKVASEFSLVDPLTGVVSDPDPEVLLELLVLIMVVDDEKNGGLVLLVDVSVEIEDSSVDTDSFVVGDISVEVCSVISVDD